MYDFMSEGGWQHYGKGLAAYQAGWRMQPERPSPAAEQGAAQSGAEPPTGEHDQVMQNFTRSIPNSKQSSGMLSGVSLMTRSMLVSHH